MLFRQQILDLRGEFDWNFSTMFFIQTGAGNFVWRDPDYGGDNTLTKVPVSREQWLEAQVLEMSRAKGTKTIRRHCGEEVSIRDFPMFLAAVESKIGTTELAVKLDASKLQIERWKSSVSRPFCGGILSHRLQEILEES